MELRGVPTYPLRIKEGKAEESSVGHHTSLRQALIDDTPPPERPICDSD